MAPSKNKFLLQLRIDKIQLHNFLKFLSVCTLTPAKVQYDKTSPMKP